MPTKIDRRALRFVGRELRWRDGGRSQVRHHSRDTGILTWHDCCLTHSHRVTLPILLVCSDKQRPHYTNPESHLPMNKDTFLSELSKLKPASTFLSVLGYRNEAAEVADYSICFHISYENAVKRSLEALQPMVPADKLEEQAKLELLLSLKASLDKIDSTGIEDLDDGYTRIPGVKGCKVHTATGNLHLFGLLNHKRVLTPGTYKTVNKRPLTIAKDRLRKSLPVSRFRQFKIVPDQVDHIAVASLTLLPPSS